MKREQIVTDLDTTPVMWCVWRTLVTKRDARYDYQITNSRSHVGTFQLRIADADTNAPKYYANSFPTVQAAIAAADDWVATMAQEDKR